MPKQQLIYNQVGVFVGPCPSSGYHFIDTGGILNNDFDNLENNFNLVFPLHRITELSYEITPPRQDVFHLSNLGPIKRPVLSNTDVKLNIGYNLMGLVNEARLGLYMNTPSGDLMTGAFRYGTGRACPISGMYSRDYTRSDDANTLNWPMACRDSRNIFVAVKNDTSDLNPATGVLYSGEGYGNDVFCFAFGDCYLDSYNFSVGVGQFPSVNVGYTCNNIEVSSSGSGVNIPAINPQTQNVYSGNNFNLPSTYIGNNVNTVLLPSDITLDIKQNSNNSTDLNDFILDFSDIKIQSLSFGFDMNRKSLYGIGYKYPIDRVPSFPVRCNVSFYCLDGDPKAGNLVDLIKTDENYDITIKLNYKNSLENFTGLAVQYEFINAKVNSSDSSVSVGNRGETQFSFTTELDPNDTTRGFFIKGYLGLWSWEDVLLGAYSGSQLYSLIVPENDQLLLSYISDNTARPIF